MLLFVKHHLLRMLTVRIWELKQDPVPKRYIRSVFSLMFHDRRVPESLSKNISGRDLCRCNVCKAFLKCAVGEGAAVSLYMSSSQNVFKVSSFSPSSVSSSVLNSGFDPFSAGCQCFGSSVCRLICVSLQGIEQMHGTLIRILVYSWDA